MENRSSSHQHQEVISRRSSTREVLMLVLRCVCRVESGRIAAPSRGRGLHYTVFSKDISRLPASARGQEARALRLTYDQRTSQDNSSLVLYGVR